MNYTLSGLLHAKINLIYALLIILYNKYLQVETSGHHVDSTQQYLIE